MPIPVSQIITAVTPSAYASLLEYTEIAARLRKYEDKREAEIVLLRAVQIGNTEAVDALLREYNGKAETLLLHAVRVGRTRIVELLLKKGADPNAKGEGELRQSVLVEAVQSGDEEIAELLLEYGANTSDAASQLALQQAVWWKHTKMVQLLLNKGITPASTKGKDRTFALVTAMHPLLLAVRQEHAAIVELLLEYSADTDTSDEDNQLALIEAVRWGHPKMVQLLLDKGINPNAKSMDGEEHALLLAVRKGHEKIVQLLLEYGTDPNASDIYSNNALHSAAVLRQHGVVKLLLSHTPHRFKDRLSAAYTLFWR